MEKQNTNYNPDKREQGSNSIYNWTRPFQSMQEQLVQQQLLDNATAEAANRRPPIPNIGLIPNRFGYDRTPPGISDVLLVDEAFSANFGDFSGTESGYMGTSFPQNPSLP